MSEPNASDKHSRPSVVLPKTLEDLSRSFEFPHSKHRWNTNEEIASWLISFDKHEEWLDKSLKMRPESGCMLMYNRKKVSYRRDGYVWKKRKDGKSTRLDHMKLKILGVECLYAYYAHSALIPTFHRRCYWLLQNPDIILVHYLNVLCQEDPKDTEGKMTISPNIPLVYNPNLCDGKPWTREDFTEQVKPMFGCHIKLDKNTIISGNDSVEAIVQFMLDEQDKLLRSRGDKTLKPKEEVPSTSGGVTPLTSPQPEIKTEDSPQDGAKACQSCSSRPQQQQIMPLVIVVSNANGSASAGPPVFTVAKTGGLRTITPLVSVLRSAQNIRQPGVSDAVCLNLEPSPVGSSTSSSEDVTVISPTPSDNSQGPKSSDSPGSAKDLSPLSASSGRKSKSKSGPRTTSRITTEESPELRRMVDNDPNLTTIQNRFRNTTEQAVPSPLHEYFRHQLDKRKEKEVSMESQSAMLAPSLSTTTRMEGVTLAPMTTTPSNMSSVTADCHANVPIPTTMYGQTHQASVNIPPAQNANLLGNFPAIPVTAQSGNSVFGNTAQSMRFNFNPPQTQAPGVLPMNTQMYTPQPMSHDVGSLPNLDIDLDFDTELFDTPLRDINPSTLTGPGMQTNNSVQSHSSTSTGSNFNQGHQNLQNLRLEEPSGNSDTTMASLSMTTGSQLQENQLVSVTEFSPDWSYPEGGVKVLVTGPWHNTNANYQCLFDSFGVPASLIQNGVLRCYCPAHEAGLVTLEVSCNNVVVSKSVVFEYKARSAQQNPSTQHEWLSLEENQFRMAILERLEQMERRVGAKNAHQQQRPRGGQHMTFEDRVVSICERLMESARTMPLQQHQSSNMRMDQAARGMTLLHLAAALGYFKLIDILVRWKNERHGLFLEYEVDAMNVDHFSCTPLMWACALGHKESALLLYHWFPAALRVCDSLGRLPVDMAKSRGHTVLADCLERLELEGQRLPSSPSSISQPIEIPQPNKNHLVPAFMVSSPATPTPESSSASAISPLVFDSPSPSSGCLSQLSISPTSQGFLSPNSMQSHSPLFNIGASDSDVGGFDEASVRGFGRRSGASTLHPSTAGQRHHSSFATNQELSSQQLLCGINTGKFLQQEDGRTTSGAISSGQDVGRSDSPMQIDANMMEDGLLNDLGYHNKPEQYLTLAEQILNALPARIKEINFADFPNPDFDIPSMSADGSGPSDMDNYRNPYEVSSPASTYSTDSCLPSPSNLSFEDDSSTADWCEFLQGGHMNSTNRRVMSAFSLLKLNDGEQRELYKAALVIQNAFRQYRGRQQQKQTELEAAVIIQSYYRRYKEYIIYKEMSDAARIIQSRFRTLKSYRHFQRSRNAAIVIQSRYRSYRAKEQYRKSRDAAILIQQRFRDKRMARLKRQQDAARKIQRFIRRYTNRLFWDV
ncbi:calmodulin-binding transcription activator 2-like isoform X2 [Amphiura filiformis]|uniref:calmodulin-binding transcription activator 2-like isoform X2 n=1 Tax=Amphiura filiformis TaxID=82378 RepID=UPI003B20BDED